MGKILVTVKNLADHICHADGKLYMDGSLILTAGARDELKTLGITVVYGKRPEPAVCPPGCTCPACIKAAQAPEPQVPEAPVRACPPGCTCPACTRAAQTCEATAFETLILAIAGILKSQYGITDPAQLMGISSQVVKTIRENI